MKKQYFSITYVFGGEQRNLIVIRPYSQKPITHLGAARILMSEAKESNPEYPYKLNEFTVLRIENGNWGN